MEKKKEKLILDGNAFYEIDLQCMEKKARREEEKKKQKKNIPKRQRK